MSLLNENCYILRGPGIEAFGQEPVGKLAPILSTRAKVTSYIRLDSFDQSLRRSGRLLMDLGTSLELMLPDGGMLCQPSQSPGKFVAELGDGPIKKALADISPLRSLLPCGSGNLDRTVLAFVDDEQKTCCRASLQILRCVKGTVVAVVRLQGLRGYGKALTDVRRKVEACGGIDFGMEELQGVPFPWQTEYGDKPAVVFTQGQSAYDAATQVIASHITVARLAETGIVADFDTEFLHDYRVALRKIRSILSLLKCVYSSAITEDLKARFSAIMSLTGSLRDLDVHQLERQKFYDMLPDSLHADLDVMFALRATERSAALAKLSDHLSSQTYAQNMTDLAQVFATPDMLKPGPAADRTVHHLVRSLIWKRFQKARKLAVNIGLGAADTQVHELRIHCKKLRYLIEFSVCLFPRHALKAAIKPLKMWQDHLGLFNDLSVQIVNLQTFLRSADTWPDGSKLQIAQSVGALTAVMHPRKLEERKKIDGISVYFTSRVTQATFRDLFHPRKEMI